MNRGGNSACPLSHIIVLDLAPTPSFSSDPAKGDNFVYLNMEARYILICFFAVVLCGSVYGEKTGPSCYECNLNMCSRNLTGVPIEQRLRANESEQCRKYHEIMASPNVTTRSSAVLELNKVYSLCEPVLRHNCKACIKVDTTVRRYEHRGNFHIESIESKVCAQEKPKSEEDNCEKRGPMWAQSIVCVCYGDKCNTGATPTFSILALVSVLVASFF